MANLIALPVGYKHEPQDSGHINHAAINANIVCRLILHPNDENAGYLDNAVRVLPANPVIGDQLSLTGAMLSQTINLQVTDVIPQDEAYVARSGGPVFILHVRTI